MEDFDKINVIYEKVWVYLASVSDARYTDTAILVRLSRLPSPHELAYKLGE
jgi:hypothetical protein